MEYVGDWPPNTTALLTYLPWNDSDPGYLSLNTSTGPLPLGRSVAISIILGIIVLGAAAGNVLVVLSVFTNRRLRTITNLYVVSLASSDLLVATLVMPLAIVVEVTGQWKFGVILCAMWTSLDVMLCTASILNLCCISLDRYFAITRPLVYATRRSKRLALIMIAVVWVAAAVITCPPILGWQEEGRWEDSSQCALTRDPGYIIYSSLGSFYLPLLVMIFVYLRIFQVASRREKRLRPYRRSFIATSYKTRCKNARRGMQSENISLTDSRDSEDAEEKMIETSLIQEHQNAAIRTGKCVSVRRLQQGLVISSALAMQELARAHRDSIRLERSQIDFPTGNSRTPTSPRERPQSPSREPLTQSNNHQTTNLNHTPAASSSQSPNSSPQLGKKHDYFSKKDEKRKERAVLLRERKAAKTLAIVVGGFIVCWLPFFLMYLIEPFCQSCQINPAMASFFVWLGYFNSVLNPFIYAFYNRDFRYSFWRLTFGLCHKDTSSSHNSLPFA